MDKINPNYVTSLRLFVTAPLSCFFLTMGYWWLAFSLMIAGESTDGLDGFVARKTNQVSDFGKIYDPMCDSICHMMIWMTFLAMGWVPLFFVLLFFVRDMVIAYTRTYLATYDIVMEARFSGKLKAITQGSVQLILVVFHICLPGDVVETVQLQEVMVAVLVTSYSLFDYLWECYRLVKNNPKVLAR